MNDKFSRKVFCDGIRDGFPIALGYFAVSFSLGIAARHAGFTPMQGFLASLLNNASAGEYAAFTLIAAQATYLEVAIITLIANARYLLMSCALAQKFSPNTPFFHRLIIAYDVTDELFGIIIPPARKSKIVAALVAISFALSFACNYLPGISSLSEGTRTILLTVIISGAAAILFPVKQDAEEAVPAENGESVQKGDHVNE